MDTLDIHPIGGYIHFFGAGVTVPAFNFLNLVDVFGLLDVTARGF